MKRPRHIKLTPDGRHVLRRKAVRAYWTMFTDELNFTQAQTAEFLLDHATPEDIRAAQQRKDTPDHDSIAPEQHPDPTQALPPATLSCPGTAEPHPRHTDHPVE